MGVPTLCLLNKEGGRAERAASVSSAWANVKRHFRERGWESNCQPHKHILPSHRTPKNSPGKHASFYGQAVRIVSAFLAPSLAGGWKGGRTEFRRAAPEKWRGWGRERLSNHAHWFTAFSALWWRRDGEHVHIVHWIVPFSCTQDTLQGLVFISATMRCKGGLSDHVALCRHTRYQPVHFAQHVQLPDTKFKWIMLSVRSCFRLHGLGIKDLTLYMSSSCTGESILLSDFDFVFNYCERIATPPCCACVWKDSLTNTLQVKIASDELLTPQSFLVAVMIMQPSLFSLPWGIPKSWRHIAVAVWRTAHPLHAWLQPYLWRVDCHSALLYSLVLDHWHVFQLLARRTCFLVIRSCTSAMVRKEM